MVERLFIGGEADGLRVKVSEHSIAWERLTEDALSLVEQATRKVVYPSAPTELYVARTIKLAISDTKALRLIVYVESTVSDELTNEDLLRRMFVEDVIAGEIDRTEYRYG